jgi:hypothetical protein
MCVEREDVKIGVYLMAGGELVLKRDIWLAGEYENIVSRYVFNFDCER